MSCIHEVRFLEEHHEALVGHQAYFDRVRMLLSELRDMVRVLLSDRAQICAYVSSRIVCKIVVSRRLAGRYLHLLRGGHRCTKPKSRMDSMTYQPFILRVF